MNRKEAAPHTTENCRNPPGGQAQGLLVVPEYEENRQARTTATCCDEEHYGEPEECSVFPAHDQREEPVREIGQSRQPATHPQPPEDAVLVWLILRVPRVHVSHGIRST